MTQTSDAGRICWPDFCERYGENALKGSVEPGDVWTTKWGVKQFGWTATCRKTGCEHIWCVYVQQGGNGLSAPKCDHSSGEKVDRVRVYADDPVIRRCQSKKHWP
jgi:hypothetical protein